MQYNNLITKEAIRTAELAVKYLQGTLSGDESKELSDWLQVTPNGVGLLHDLSRAEFMEREMDRFGSIDTQDAYNKVLYRICQEDKPKLRYGFTNKKWQFAFSVAAIVVFSVGLIILYITEFYKPKPHALTAEQRYTEDILPAGKSAFLRGASGEFYLAGMDTLLHHDSMAYRISKSGEITYTNQAKNNLSRGFDTLLTPTGGTYTVVLEDGTRVQLNANSRLEYPVHFEGNERIVSLKGEAYFQIAENRNKPFQVKAKGVTITAVGTAFDVDEKRFNGMHKVMATVTEGAIMIGNEDDKVIVKAGEAAFASKHSVSAVVTMKRLSDITAWKDGLFSFDETNLKVVMEEIGAWYGVNIKYDPSFTGYRYFTGDLRRDKPLSEILKTIEKTGIALFALRNKTITVLPYL